MIRNPNRIDHVAGVVRPENFETVIARMSELFETTFDGPFDRPAMGSRMVTSLDAGIELITPTTDDPENMFNKLLAANGEHWISVVMGARDMDRTCDHLAKLGYKPQMRRDVPTGQGDQPARLTKLEQAVFAPGAFGGLSLSFCYSEEAGG